MNQKHDTEEKLFDEQIGRMHITVTRDTLSVEPGPEGGIVFYNIKDIDGLRGGQFEEHDNSNSILNGIRVAFGTTKYNKLKYCKLVEFLTYRGSEVELLEVVFQEPHGGATQSFRNECKLRHLSLEDRHKGYAAAVKQVDRLKEVLSALRH